MLRAGSRRFESLQVAGAGELKKLTFSSRETNQTLVTLTPPAIGAAYVPAIRVMSSSNTRL